MPEEMGNLCPQCGAPLVGGSRTCKYCGYTLSAPAVQPQAVQRPVVQPQVPYAQRPYAPNAAPPYAAPPYTAPPQYPPRPAQPPYGQPYYPPPYTQPVSYNQKSKTTAGLLALLLGGLGIHKFYLNKPGQGILYILFCWTCIPSFIALIEGIVYLTCSDEQFNMKYVRH